MKKTLVTLTLFACVWVLSPIPPADAQAARSYKVIANPSAPSDSVKRKDLSKYFLKKTTKWEDGQTVVPVDAKASSGVRSDFSEEVHDRPVSAIEAYWQQRIFSGRGLPPPQKGTDAEIIAFVRSTPGAIGYVSASAASGDCKILTIDP